MSTRKQRNKQTFEIGSDVESEKYGSTFHNTEGYYPLSSSLPTSEREHIKEAENRMYSVLSDGNIKELSNDDFGDNRDIGNKAVKSGRQRKKMAARSKGGEFQTRRSKKRVYFCCIASEIDVQNLFDYLVSAGGLLFGWQYRLYNEVLHLYKAGQEEPLPTVLKSKHGANTNTSNANETAITYSIEQQLITNPIVRAHSKSHDGHPKSKVEPLTDYDTDYHQYDNSPQHNEAVDGHDIAGVVSSSNQMTTVENPFRINGQGAQEVFVFDFGAVVFWGFSRGEEVNLLKTIRNFVTKGSVGAPEFQSGVDDMAFVTSPDAECISLANDVITLPDDSVAKQRLSVSFAIAQSSVLSIFEARIDTKVEEYKYIPEALASHGKVHLTERQLGMMIGEVFVIRHDVNLHTEILDTPDFFWKEEKFEEEYKMVMSYLEMSGRTEILNKRLDMLRELLDVLQQQMENAHAVKLEMIVIYLIVIEVVLQVFGVLSK